MYKRCQFCRVSPNFVYFKYVRVKKKRLSWLIKFRLLCNKTDGSFFKFNDFLLSIVCCVLSAVMCVLLFVLNVMFCTVHTRDILPCGWDRSFGLSDYKRPALFVGWSRM